MINGVIDYIFEEDKEKHLDKHGCLKEAKIVIPEGPEREKLLEQLERVSNGEVCGNCRHFRLEEGQRELLNKKLFMQLFTDMEHNPDWYGKLNLYGVCSMVEGHMCHVQAPAVIPRHLIDSNVPYELKDVATKCSSFEKGGSFRREMKVFMGGGKTYNSD